MAYSSDDIKQHYPLPVYNYQVTLLENNQAIMLAFSEVNGLALEHEQVIYKDGLSFLMGHAIVPGKIQPIRITLKRGMVINGNYLAAWLKTAYHAPYSNKRKRDVLIYLFD
jgi:phage tail-like protein